MKPRSYPVSRPARFTAAALGLCLAATSSANAGTCYWNSDGSGSPDLVNWAKALEGDTNLTNAAGSDAYTLNGTGKQVVRLVVIPE